ncbi:MAG: hypothetical protein U1C57_00565, partial [Candidatus Doudnabacteria bacterium]|nr:hypothetical protein [Candidatus Doudnabacteria bacterium]
MNNKITKKIIAAFCCLLFVAGLIVLGKTFNARAVTGVPEIISYQGRLTDADGDLLGGSGTSYNFKFSIWDNAAVGSGAQLWPASTVATTTVTVTEGVFNVNIGEDTDDLTYNFNDNDTVYLQVQVKQGTSGEYETLSPRQQITSAGYAINASTLGGYAASQTPTASQVPVLNSSGNLVLTGGGNFNSATTTDTLSVGGALRLADGSVSLPGLTFSNDLNTGLYRIGDDTLGFTTGGIERLRIDTATSTFATSLIIDTSVFTVNVNEDRVGIGTASPTSTLGVVGDSRFNGAVNIAGGLTLGLNCTDNSNDGKLTANINGLISCADDVSGGGSGSNWNFGTDQTFIAPSTTVGVIVSASSTITTLASDALTVGTSLVIDAQTFDSFTDDATLENNSGDLR